MNGKEIQADMVPDFLNREAQHLAMLNLELAERCRKNQQLASLHGRESTAKRWGAVAADCDFLAKDLLGELPVTEPTQSVLFPE